jgi:UDP-glucose 4-epimerase
MDSIGIKKLIFSSSATVYGEPDYLPYDELHPTKPTNPYDKTKLQIEEMLRDIARSDNDWSIVCLRYFNRAGAHPSALIGENPRGALNNPMPYIIGVAGGQYPELSIFGNDYGIKDGTGERDYIHVMDLAEGHQAALDILKPNIGWQAINLESGKAYSVLEIISAFENASGKLILKKYVARRSGDLAICFANVNKAKLLLGWSPTRSLVDICEGTWIFEQKLLG